MIYSTGQTCNGLGAMCWSTATGVTAGGCCAGTQCSPWLPSGGTWDGSSPWYCLSLPTLADGATCDYVNWDFLNIVAWELLFLDQFCWIVCQWFMYQWSVWRIHHSRSHYNSSSYNSWSNNHNSSSHNNHNCCLHCSGERYLQWFNISWFISTRVLLSIHLYWDHRYSFQNVQNLNSLPPLTTI